MSQSLAESPEISNIERLVMFPGQGPDPRSTGAIPVEYAKTYEEVSGIKLEDVPNLDDETAFSGTVAQPLHVLRLASFEKLFNDHLAEINIDPEEYKGDSSFIPASLSEYLMNYICGAWDFQTALEVAKKRGELSDEIARKHPNEFAMLATFFRKVLSKDEEAEDQELSPVLATIIKDHSDDLEDVVYFGSHPSPSMITLSGRSKDMKTLEGILKEFSDYKIGSTSLDRINGAYHSPYMEGLRQEMAEFIARNVVTNDPSPSIGIYYSPTSTHEVRTREDVIRNASDLLVRPVNQRPILHQIRARIAEISGNSRLMVLEFGNSRNHKWGRHQGVQTTCFRDYRIYYPFINRDGRKVDAETLAFDGSADLQESDQLEHFVQDFAHIA